MKVPALAECVCVCRGLAQTVFGQLLWLSSPFFLCQEQPRARRRARSELAIFSGQRLLLEEQSQPPH